MQTPQEEEQGYKTRAEITTTYADVILGFCLCSLSKGHEKEDI